MPVTDHKPSAVVPARNEERTVTDVVRVLVMSRVFDRVVVVDDGSSDATGKSATRAGARVLSLSLNRGKAEAMLAGVAQCPGDVAFFDADLVGLRPDHVTRLAAHFRAGFDQVCGLRDYGWLNILQALTPVMTGERFVKRWVLDRVPASCWRGYAIETVINFIVDSAGGSTCLVSMDGVTIVNKTRKVGALRGWAQHFRMAGQMADARASLAQTGGAQCRIR